MLMTMWRPVQVLPSDDGIEGRPQGTVSWCETLHEVALPLVVLSIGMGVSLLALKPLLSPKPGGGQLQTSL